MFIAILVICFFMSGPFRTGSVTTGAQLVIEFMTTTNITTHMQHKFKILRIINKIITSLKLYNIQNQICPNTYLTTFTPIRYNV